MSKIAIPFFLIMLCACGSTPTVPNKVSIKPQFKEQILPMNINFYGSTKIVPVLGYGYGAGTPAQMGYQQGVSMGSPGAGLIGGLIAGAIIDSAIENDANNRIEPFREATVGIDYRSQLSESVEQILTDESWIQVKETKLLDQFKRRPRKWHVVDPFIDVHYKFYALGHLNQIGLIASIEIYHSKSEAIETKSRYQPIPIYKDTFKFVSEALPEPVKSQEEIDKDVAIVKEAYKNLSKSDRKNPKLISKHNKALKKAKREEYTFEERDRILYARWTENDGALINKIFSDGKENIVNKLKESLSEVSKGQDSVGQ